MAVQDVVLRSPGANGQDISLSGSGATTLIAPLIASGGQVYTPVVVAPTVLAAPLIASGSQVFTPAVTYPQTVTAPIIASTAGFPTPNRPYVGPVIPIKYGPMPHISLGKPVYGTGTVSKLFDNGYGYTVTTPGAWTCTAGSWAAINLGAGPSQLLVALSNDLGDGSASYLAPVIEAYRIQVSNDSTNGSDGTWTTVVTETANPSINREHKFSFTGYSWVKLLVDTCTGGQIDEFDIWDASAGTENTFAFLGDSLTVRSTSRTQYSGGGTRPSFGDIVLENTGQYPLQVTAATIGLNAADWAANIGSALALFPDVKYWCIGIGTNNGSTMPGGLSAYVTDMTTVINAILTAGRIPILARVPWTGTALYGGGNYDTCGLRYLNDNGVEALFASFGASLRRGPDLYQLMYDNGTAFDILSDPHWNDSGSIAWNNAWGDSLGLSTMQWVNPPLISGTSQVFAAAIVKDAIAPPLIPSGEQVFAPVVDYTLPNNAVRFDTLADTVRLSTLPGASQPLTFAGWFRPVVDLNNYSSIFALENAAATQYNELITEVDGTTLALYDHVAGSRATVGVMTVGTWYRIAVVFTSGAFAAYIGTEGSATLTKVTGTLSNVGTPGFVWIGNTSANERSNGRFARARVWTAALSDAELEAEFHSESAVRTSNLLGEWFPRTVTASTATTAVTGANLTSQGAASYTIEAGPLIVQLASPPLIASGSQVFAATEVILGSTGSTLNPPLIASGETVYAPSLALTSTLAAPVIGSTETFFGSTIVATVVAPAIGSTSTVYTPSLALVNALVAPLIGSTETFFGPTLVSTLVAPLIGSTATLFGPSLSATLVAPAIPTGSQVFAPSLALTNTLAAPAIAATSQAFAPSLALSNTLVAPVIGSTETFFGPALTNALTLVAPAIGSTSTVYTPSLALASTIVAPLIGSTLEIFVPVVGQFTALAAPVIGSTETFFGPTLTSALTLAAPLIGSTATLFGPTIGQFTSLTAPVIASTETFFGASLTSTIVAPLIGSTGAVYTPSLTAVWSAPVIGSTASVFAPSLTAIVSPPAISSGSQVFAPSLALASTIVAPLIGSTAALFGPTVGQFTALSAPVIGPDSTVYTPSLALTNALAAPAIGSTANVFAPAVTSVLAAPAIGPSSQVFAATVAAGNLNLVAPAIGSTSQVFAPTLAAGASTLVAPLIGSTASVFAPSLTNVNGLSAAFIGSTSTVSSISAINFRLSAPAISSTAQLFVPAVSPLLTAPFIPGTSTTFPPALASILTLQPPVIGSTETLFAPTFASDNTITAPLFGPTSQVFTATIILNLDAPLIPSGSQVFSPNLSVGEGWPVATTKLPLIRALELPLPETLTRIVGIHQSDVIIRSAVEAGLADLRANPFLLDYVFASLPQDVLTWREYGEKSLQAAKKWFLTTEVPVTIEPHINESRWPQITISLLESSEVVPEATLGDVNYEPNETSSANWPALTPQFTPQSFNPSTGVVVLAAVPEAWVGRGMYLVDKQGQAHEITESLSETSFRISVEPGAIPDLRSCVLKSRRPSWNIAVESSSFKESYRLGIHTTDPVHLTWLHAIVQFALLRYKQVLLEARGFERSTISSSQVARDQGFETENLFSRFITISGNVRQFWPKAITPVIDGVEMDNRDDAPEGSGFAVSGLDADVSVATVDDPAEQLWIGNLDTIRARR